ncbi:MAG TPA: hypothetical protein VMW43_04165 [Bacteroidota bacterium]|nr:hypothetical protein [Bacteroidota bacterium]
MRTESALVHRIVGGYRAPVMLIRNSAEVAGSVYRAALFVLNLKSKPP